MIFSCSELFEEPPQLYIDATLLPQISKMWRLIQEMENPQDDSSEDEELQANLQGIRTAVTVVTGFLPYLRLLFIEDYTTPSIGVQELRSALGLRSSGNVAQLDTPPLIDQEFKPLDESIQFLTYILNLLDQLFVMETGSPALASLISTDTIGVILSLDPQVEIDADAFFQRLEDNIALGLLGRILENKNGSLCVDRLEAVVIIDLGDLLKPASTGELRRAADGYEVS